MRPRVLRAIAVGWLLCLAMLLIPFQLETRLVGLGGVVLLSAMYVGERHPPRPRGPGRREPEQRRGEPPLPFLVHGSRRR